MRTILGLTAVGMLAQSLLGQPAPRQLEYVGAGLWLWTRGQPGSGPRPEKPHALQVRNPHGGIRISLDDTDTIRIRGRAEGRQVQPDDFSATQAERRYQILVEESLDLEITVPYGLFVQAVTADGPIDYTGFGLADFQTDHGDVTLTFPAEATRFELLSTEQPDAFSGDARLRRIKGQWAATDHLGGQALSYGQLTLRGQRPRSITLRDDPELLWMSPVKMPWQAEQLLPRLFRHFDEAGLQDRSRQEAGTSGREQPSADFSSDVRLVQLDVSVTDREGRPVAGLSPQDFEVVEDGEPQRITDVSSVDAPFNLVLLLDCSSSTEAERPQIRQAAQSFVSVARERDKVAVYALGETLFQALAKLTPDHERLRAAVGVIDRFGGATPLYDSIVLAYGEEIAALPRERNALVILSDGVDNRASQMTGLDRTGQSRQEPSRVRFEELRKAAREMRALIYPIVLDPVNAMAKSDPLMMEQAKKWRIAVRQRSEALAEASAGKAFYSNSLDDLDDVYTQVADELRSVYTISYSPANQDFDGGWRSVRVKADGPELVVRARAGYFAR